MTNTVGVPAGANVNAVRSEPLFRIAAISSDSAFSNCASVRILPSRAGFSTASTRRSEAATPKSLCRSSSSSCSSEPSSSPPRARTPTSVSATSLIFCQSDRFSSLAILTFA